MNDIERLLWRYFRDIKTSRDCPDDITILRYAEGRFVNNPAFEKHIAHCINCQFRLEKIREIQKIASDDDPVPKEFEIDEDKLIEAALGLLEELSTPEETCLRLAADTSVAKLQEVSFSAPDGKSLVRCLKGRQGKWSLTLIRPSFSVKNPVLLEINNSLHKIVFPYQPLDIPELRFNKDTIHQMALNDHRFFFKDDFKLLKDKLPSEYELQIHPAKDWILSKNKEASSAKSFHLVKINDEYKSGSLPLECAEFDELEVFLFDVEVNRVELEILD